MSRGVALNLYAVFLYTLRMGYRSSTFKFFVRAPPFYRTSITLLPYSVDSMKVFQLIGMTSVCCFPFNMFLYIVWMIFSISLGCRSFKVFFLCCVSFILWFWLLSYLIVLPFHLESMLYCVSSFTIVLQSRICVFSAIYSTASPESRLCIMRFHEAVYPKDIRGTNWYG